MVGLTGGSKHGWGGWRPPLAKSNRCHCLGHGGELSLKFLTFGPFCVKMVKRFSASPDPPGYFRRHFESRWFNYCIIFRSCQNFLNFNVQFGAFWISGCILATNNNTWIRPPPIVIRNQTWPGLTLEKIGRKSRPVKHKHTVVWFQNCDTLLILRILN